MMVFRTGNPVTSAMLALALLSCVSVTNAQDGYPQKPVRWIARYWRAARAI